MKGVGSSMEDIFWNRWEIRSVTINHL